MAITSLAPDDIFVPDRLRGLDDETVAHLKASIEAIGLRTPLSVRFVSQDEGWALIAGRHRLQAAIELGLSEVPVRVEHGDETDARLWEIAENLHRAELTVAERSEHIAEWVRLTEERQKQLVQLAPKAQIGHRPESGSRAASRELGLEHTAVVRAQKINALAPEAKAEARALHLDDNQTALLKAAKAPSKEEQIRSLREHANARAERPVSPAPAPLNDLETEEQWMGSIMRVWNRGAPQWRERFLSTIDTPVADNTSALRVVK